MLARRPEEASLNAWPALQQAFYDGWILRFSQGYTKRANSVNPLFQSTRDMGEKVAACEAAYAERGLPAIFRLTPFSSPPGLDAALAERGYRRIDPTLVLHLDLQRHATPAPATPTCRSWRSTRRRVRCMPGWDLPRRTGTGIVCRAHGHRFES